MRSKGLIVSSTELNKSLVSEVGNLKSALRVYKEVAVEYEKLDGIGKSIVAEGLAGKEITEINYASECLNLDSIVESMKAEQNRLQKTPKFNLKESLNEDTCSFVLLAVLYFYIKNNE